MDESPASPHHRRGPARLYDQESPGPLPGAAFPEADEAPPAPAVVAVVVAPAAAEAGDLERTLLSLRDQDYPNLTVLVVDAGGGSERTAAIAAVLPNAFVRRLEQDPGFAAAANEALSAVEGAPYLLVCRAGAVLDPPAARVLVEEAFRSNAGVVGPKLVDLERPEVLRQVGLAIDKFATPYSAIELDELDQEQHDAVRDVFFVPGAAFLIRTDLFHVLGGFDRAVDGAGEDLDVCWRARLAGARVLVVPDARVRVAAGLEPASAFEQRNRVRIMLKAYSAGSLLRIVPLAFAVSMFEALALLLAGRRSQARVLVDAWISNLRHFGDVRATRRETQALRVVSDADIRFLQVSGSARLRDFVVERIEHGGRARELVQSGRDLVDATAARMRWPAVVAWALLIGVPLIGTRNLITGRVPSVGTLLAWPGVPALVRELTGSWRFSGLGSAGPMPPGLALLAGAGTLTFGAAALARTLIVALSIPAGAAGAYRMARGQRLDRWPALAAAAAYAANPVARNAIANGRLGAIVLFAALPFVLRRVLMWGDDATTDAKAGTAIGSRQGWLRRALPAGMATAAVGAIDPVAALVPLVAAAVLIVSAGRSRRGAASAAVTTLAATVIAFVLLMPWSLSLVMPGSDAASAGLAFRPHLSLGAVTRFATGPAGGGPLGFALVVAAALALVFCGPERFPTVARGWALAAMGFALAFVSGQSWGAAPWPAPETALVLAAAGLALAAGAGAASFVEELPKTSAGWRHVAAVLAGAGLLITVLGATGAAGNGRFGLPARDWASGLSWMDTSRGEFRLLWTGDPSVIPASPWTLADGTGYALARNGPGDARVLWPISASGTTGLVGDALADAQSGRTDRLGHLLAPMAVRYIAVPLRRGPHASGPNAVRPTLLRALGAQVDLRRLPVEPGLVLYENTVWAPAGAAVAGPVPGPQAALTTDVAGAAPLHRRGWRDASGSTPRAGSLLWSETFDHHWTAVSHGRRLAHSRAFGWANGFHIGRAGRVRVSHGGLALRFGGLLLEALLWLGAALMWRRNRRAASGSDGPPDAGDARRPEPGPLVTPAGFTGPLSPATGDESHAPPRGGAAPSAPPSSSSPLDLPFSHEEVAP